VVAKRLKPIMVEAVVRGYIIGSGWKDYQDTGSICGIALPAGLQQAEKLPQPIFTPAAKADLGEHDENISFAEMEERIGAELAAKMRDVAIQLYKKRRIRRHARHHHRRHQVRIRPGRKRRHAPDGRSADGRLVALLAGRFLPAGISPPSFDKQFVRDYLETLTGAKPHRRPRCRPTSSKNPGQVLRSHRTPDRREAEGRWRAKQAAGRRHHGLVLGLGRDAERGRHPEAVRRAVSKRK
jgi:phosphoribosylaminoimidazole-succinocarboxamide synthase